MTIQQRGVSGGSPSTLYAYTGTYASLPPAGGYAAGTQALATDVGPNGSAFQSDGVSRWLPVNGRCVLANMPLPVGMAPTFPANASGTANGAITFGTAANQVVYKGYFYYPANSLVASHAAGFYYTEMSSNTAAIVYNNVYTPAVGTFPTEPVIKASFSGAVPGGAGVTAETNFFKANLPGGILGNFGGTRSSVLTQHTNSAGGKNVVLLYNASNAAAGYMASSASMYADAAVKNVGAANRQLAHGNWGNFAAANSVPGLSVDTSADVTLNYTMTRSVATDYLVVANLKVLLDIDV